MSSDGSVVTVFYYNGDMKESHRYGLLFLISFITIIIIIIVVIIRSGLVRYLYSDTGTWHTTHPDGREVTQFSNGQTEVE